MGLLAVVLLLGIVLAPTIAVRSDARAEITNYLTGFDWRAPNSFEPGGYDRPGTAANFLVQKTHNWSIFSNMGNLGIGNGSVATFGDLESVPSSHTDQYFMAGDVSQAPIDPARQLNLNVAGPAAVENNVSGNETAPNVPGVNATSETMTIKNNSMGKAFNNFSLAGANNSSQPFANNLTETPADNASVQDESANPQAPYTPENLTYSAFHPINLGRPVNDLLYQHPFAISISTYCRLVGLATPSGLPVNIGMRCLSYGY